jgi:hypothetical protein
MTPQTNGMKEWIAANDGLLSAIASRLHVTRQAVSLVAHGKRFSKYGRIEGVLADLGAPGMRERQLQARARDDEWTNAELARLIRELKGIQRQKKGRAA